MRQQTFWPEPISSRKPFSLRELPESYRPETRVQREGPQTLSDVELVALVVGETKRQSAQDTAGRVLSLGERLNRATVGELTRIVGSRRRAVRLAAALELGRRLAKRRAESRMTVKTPEDAAHVLEPHLSGLDREHFVALCLDTKNGVLAVETVSVGTLNASSVHPRELFKAAVTRSAAAVIAAHNHPSGDPAPSRQDIELTRKLVKAGELMGIPILDHIIVGDGRWASLKAEGTLDGD
ncbi:MAG: DNA repair protein RadC [Candidatus Desulforudis sp.]|nr:DNA repair protein RadC [Desulforudis sp.]